MRISLFRKFIVLVAAASVLACFGGAGDDEDFLPQITALNHCKAPVGDQLIIDGGNFRSAQGLGQVEISGKSCPIVSWTSNRIVCTVPAGATSGSLVVRNDGLDAVTFPDFVVGTRTPVTEVEPNDDINGANATSVEGNEEGTGVLGGVFDKDHFHFHCIFNLAEYTIKVTPRVVDTVYVNGIGFPLDVNGECALTEPRAVNRRLLVGITDGSGAYSISVKYLRPTP